MAGEPRRVPWTRVVLDDGQRRTQLFGFGGARPGSGNGLMVSIDGTIPGADWTYALLEAPPGHQVTAAARDGDVVVAGAAPKLHLHADGYVSVNATGTLPRRKMRTAPLTSLTEGHYFSVMARWPMRFAEVTSRVRDATFVVSGGEPETVKIVGRIGRLDNLQDAFLEHPDQVQELDLGHDDGSVVPTIFVRLDGLGIYARMEIFLSAPYVADEPGPRAGVYAFDPTVPATEPAQMLGIWSLPANPAAGVASP